MCAHLQRPSPEHRVALMASLAARDDCRALLAKGVRVEPLLL